MLSASYKIFRNLCPMCFSPFSHVQLFATLWTVSHQAPLSMGFSKQEYWSGWLCPFPGDLPNPGNLPDIGIEPMSHVSCIGKWDLYHLGCPKVLCASYKIFRNLQLHINCKLILTYSKLTVRETESLFKIPK